MPKGNSDLHLETANLYRIFLLATNLGSSSLIVQAKSTFHFFRLAVLRSHYNGWLASLERGRFIDWVPRSTDWQDNKATQVLWTGDRPDFGSAARVQVLDPAVIASGFYALGRFLESDFIIGPVMCEMYAIFKVLFTFGFPFLTIFDRLVKLAAVWLLQRITIGPLQSGSKPARTGYRRESHDRLPPNHNGRLQWRDLLLLDFGKQII